MVRARFLLVDSNIEHAKALKEYFENFGYETDICSSGSEAIKNLSRKQYDLVICDLILDDLKGLELRKYLDDRAKEIPFIFTSGYADMKLLTNLLQEGVHFFILKPYSLERLKEVAEKALEREELKKEVANLKILLSLHTFEKDILKEHTIEGSLHTLENYINHFCKPDHIFYCWFQSGKKIYDKSLYRGMCSILMSKATKLNPDLLQQKYFEIGGEELDSLPIKLKEVLLYFVSESEDQFLGLAIAREKSGFKDIEKNSFQVLMNYFENFFFHLRYKEKLEKSYFELIESLAMTIEAKDSYTEQHTKSVEEIALKIGEKLGLKRSELDILRKASRLHDIGKIGVPDHILLKPGKLTSEEFEVIKKHPVIGYEILTKSENLHEVAKVVLHHHEWYSGKGYPHGLKGEDIPLLSRILFLADAYHALISDRPYRKAYSKEEALNIVKSEAGEKFDPRLVSVLEDLVLERVV